MKILSLLLFLLIGITSVSAQEIEAEKVFLGYKFTMNNKTLDFKGMQKLMIADEQATRLIKKARKNNTISTILGSIGGSFVGIPIGAAVAGGDAPWVLAGVGAAFIGVAIPISIRANNQAHQAAERINQVNSSQPNPLVPVTFKFIGNQQGLGLALSF
ncbi:hypothetical protein APR41_15170 [Salegentibacter salinarum]|uniref:Uncharacterized protein n=1 Tax=Salegentibacter salinarum TaxID=447422 RepID=A0A2N0TZ30_9FLAO|nr:hypothetical protein [Salegentibacter salinarum]PKD20010.1 hypothetical protein APR41_15170 [Salegentibacter salinarum]SKB97440.1 hypothetical protein SAMN05660903_03586 [Salegentibacter salinarum]